MKNKFTYVLISAVMGITLFSGCEKEKPVTTTNKSDITGIEVNFNALLNNEPLVPLGVADLKPKNGGEYINISNWSFLISNFSLVKEDGEVVKLGDGYQWISVRSNRTKFKYTSIPKGTYKSIKYTIGLDSSVNHGDPNIWGPEHPLNPNLTGLHWGWSGGYIFHVLEGNFKPTASSSTTSGYSFHTATMKFVRDYELKLNFTIDEGKVKIANISMFAEKYFDSQNSILLSVKSGSHSEGSAEDVLLMEKFVENMVNVFQLTEVK